MKITKFLYRLAISWIKNRYKIHGEWAEDKLLYATVIDQLRCVPILLDRRYRVTTLDKWKEIIESDTLNEIKKWKKDVFDCDNFALAMVAHVNEVYELNSIGFAIGTVKKPSTLEEVGKHAYNVIAAKDNGKLTLYILEPQNDEIVLATPKARLRNYIYETEVVVFG